MRAIIIVLTLAVPLVACGDANPTFGSGGWQDDDVPEAVPVGEAAEPVAPTQAPAAAPPARPAPATTQEPEATEEEAATASQPTVAGRAPVVDPTPVAPPPEPVTATPPVDPHAGHQMPADPAPAGT